MEKKKAVKRVVKREDVMVEMKEIMTVDWKDVKWVNDWDLRKEIPTAALRVAKMVEQKAALTGKM